MRDPDLRIRGRPFGSRSPFDLRLTTDSFGRQFEVRYPNGEVVTNVYDAHSMKRTTDIEVAAIRERWLAEGSESDLGLWWLADDVREVLGAEATEQEVQAVTLDALRPLLETGALRAVDVFKDGKFELWNGDVETQLERIAKGWRSVGKPDIGDVVWFVGRSRSPNRG